MEINVSRLKSILSKYSHFVMYGCGEFAKETYCHLKEIDRKPDFCVVTIKRGIDEYFDDGVPIHDINDQIENIRKNQILVLVAVSELYEQEIANILQEVGLEEYIAITDFDRSNRKYLQKFDDMSIQECVKEIAEWHIDFTKDYQTEAVSEMTNIDKLVQNRGKNTRKITFVLGALTPRVIKIASALLNQGYELKLLAGPHAAIQKICVNELNNLEMQFVVCNTIQELMYRIIVEDSNVVHLFTHRGNLDYDKILIKMKQLFPPIIYDEYDIVNKCYTNISQDILDNERYCLENTDAICNRGYEIDYLKDECQFAINVKVLQFHDYCCDEQCENVLSDDKELSICYVGLVIPKEEYPEFFQFFYELGEKCRHNKCHLHIYPNMWNEEKQRDYIKLSQNNEYVCFHKPVPFEQLSTVISKYDYGILPIKKYVFNKGMIYNTKEKMIYASTNKYFDYLDAGLPIIAASPIKLVEFLKEKGVLINWTIEDYDFEELRRKKKELKEKVFVERQKLQIRNHIQELIDLYNTF